MILDLMHNAKNGDFAAIFLLAASTLVTIFILGIIFYFIDSSFLPETKTNAVAINKSYSAEHYQPQVTIVGSTPITTMIYIPATWNITANVYDKNITCPVTENEYNKLKKDDYIFIYLVIGRLSNNFYCNGVKLDS